MANKIQLVNMAPKSPDKDTVFIKETASLEMFKIPLLCLTNLSITLGFSSKSGSEDRYLPNPRVSLENWIRQLHSDWELQSLKQLLQNVLLTHFGVPLSNLWVMTWILKNDGLSLEEKKKESQMQIYITVRIYFWCWWKGGLLYVCVPASPKKKKKRKCSPAKNHNSPPPQPPYNITLANPKPKLFQACYG